MTEPAASQEGRGATLYAHDVLQSVHTQLRYAVYQTEPRGTGNGSSPATRGGAATASGERARA